MRILIIEDEPVIALDLQDLLDEAGFAVVGVAGKLETALTLINQANFDAAIVDANLGGVSSGPAAAALVAHRIPFVVLSGYSLKTQEAGFPAAVFIQKPCRLDHLISVLKSLKPQQLLE
jgi:DNA-binding response OmpR family regulator